MKRNKFSLSNYKLLTLDMGKLVPINWMEVLPGDTFQQATSAFIRVTPLMTPVMHPVVVRIHHWYVPNRLIWEDFEDFITGGPDGLDATVPPTIDFSSVAEGDLADYLGIPTGTYSTPLSVSALPFRAYDLIYNEHYRDADLITELDVDLGNGTDATTNTAIQNVSWGKDAFTTARPWQQKGDTVTIPLGDTAPVEYTPGHSVYIRREDNDNIVNSVGLRAGSTGHLTQDSETNNLFVDPNNSLYADLNSATGINIADLRLALSVQRYQEARAQYGSRYVEYLRYLGVRSSDARLSLPEYLAGGRQVIQFSEVLQTAEGTGTNVGEMKGHGVTAMRTNRYRRFFEEHGIVISMMSVVPKSIYSSALHKGWFRAVKEDYFQRELQMIGEQEVLNKEVQVDHTSPDDVFGYQPRYNEYRQNFSTIHGEFRSSPLWSWHMARIFGSDVSLNQSFIDCVPTDRVYANTANHPLLVMANHSIQARRQIQKYAKTRTF